MGAAVETMARIIAVAAISLLIASANAYDLGFSEDVRAFIEGTEHLKAIVELAEQDEAGLAQLIVESPLAAIASNVTVGPWMEKNNSVPLVVAHGMGDLLQSWNAEHHKVLWQPPGRIQYLHSHRWQLDHRHHRWLPLEPGKQRDPRIHHQVQRPSCAQLYVHLRNQRWCWRIPFLQSTDPCGRCRVQGIDRGARSTRVQPSLARHPLPSRLLQRPFPRQRELVPEALAACRMEQRSDRQPDIQSQLGQDRQVRVGHGH